MQELTLPARIELQERGLSIPADASYEELLRAWTFFEQVDATSNWAKGDILLATENGYGEMYAQFLDPDKSNYQHLNQCKVVAKKFETITRVINLSWTHYRQALGVPLDVALVILKDAEKHLYSAKQVADAVKAYNKHERFIENTTDEVADIESVRIIHADVLDGLKTIADNSIDLVCIDPPYNMDKADWDSYGSGEDFADWAESWLKECQRVLKISGSIYVFGINRMLSHIQHRMEKMGFKYRSWIAWDTIQGAGGGLWVNRHEGILYFSKSDEVYEDSDAVKLERHEENVREYKGKTYEFKNPSNIWRFPCVDEKNKDRTPHPTQKPVELIERIIKASCPVNGVVLDCFFGSGTTGVACIETDRKCIGIEQDAAYVEMARRRLSTKVAA